eukprot:COSAG01_NODE_3323_length_6256_cov_2.121813_4_plen_505_part_00
MGRTRKATGLDELIASTATGEGKKQKICLGGDPPVDLDESVGCYGGPDVVPIGLSARVAAGDADALNAVPGIKPWLVLPVVIEVLESAASTDLQLYLTGYVRRLTEQLRAPGADYEDPISLKSLEDAVAAASPGGSSDSEWSRSIGFSKRHGSYYSGHIRSVHRKLELYHTIQENVLPKLLRLIAAPSTDEAVMSYAVATASCFAHVKAVEATIVAALEAYPLQSISTATEASQCALSSLLLAAVHLGGLAASIDWSTIQMTLFRARNDIINAKSAADLRQDEKLREACGLVGSLNLMSLVASVGMLMATETTITAETIQFMTDCTKNSRIRWDKIGAMCQYDDPNAASYLSAMENSHEKAIMAPWGMNGSIVSTIEKHRNRIATTQTDGLVDSLIRGASLCARGRHAELRESGKLVNARDVLKAIFTTYAETGTGYHPFGAVVARTRQDLNETQHKYMWRLVAVEDLWLTPPGQYSKPVLDEYNLHMFGLPTTPGAMQAFLDA